MSIKLSPLGPGGISLLPKSAGFRCHWFFGEDLLPIPEDLILIISLFDSFHTFVGGVHGCGRSVVVNVDAAAPFVKKNIRIRNRQMWWRTITAVLLMLNTAIGVLVQPTSAYVMTTRTTILSRRNLNNYCNNNYIHYGGNSKTTSVPIRTTTMKQQWTTPTTIYPCTYGSNDIDEEDDEEDDDNDPSMSYRINNQDLQQRLRYYQQKHHQRRRHRRNLKHQHQQQISSSTKVIPIVVLDAILPGQQFYFTR